MQARVITLLTTLPLTLSVAKAEVFQEAYIKPFNNTEIEVDANLEDLFLGGSSVPWVPDQFGYAVDISGDTLVVGAPFEDGNATGDQSDLRTTASGAAYVYTRSGNTWSFETYLKASDPSTYSSFGAAVAIDGATIAVGSKDANSVYIFTRAGTNWTEQAKLQPTVLESGDNFGFSLALEGDNLVVGAPYEDGGIGGVNSDATDNSASSAGAAYVFNRTGTNWTQSAYLKPQLAEGSDRFGESVALSATRVAVGATGEDSAATGVNGDVTDNSASGSGAVFLFARLPGGTWTPAGYVKASNTDSSDSFGAAVALDGDLLVVGAHFEASAAAGINGNESNNGLGGSGAAYVFREDGGWSQEAYLKAAAPGENDVFGYSLDVSGNTLVIGACQEAGISTGIDGDADNDFLTGMGAVYVFRRDGAGTWTQDHYLKPAYYNLDEIDLSIPNPTDICAALDPTLLLFEYFLSGPFFGWSVAIDGTAVAAGAPFDDSSASGVNVDPTNRDGPDSGAAYTFELDYTDPLSLPDLSVQQPPMSDLISGSSGTDFGLVGAGSMVTLPFALVSQGGTNLTGLTIGVTGPEAPNFTPSITASADLSPGTGIVFQVTFSPSAPGLHEATLTVTSNDPDENPFTVALTGYGTLPGTDTDGDGMNDLAEWALRPIGFDWQTAQPGFVSRYYQTASAAGLYTADEIATLIAPSLLLERDGTTGRFGLTFDMQWSDDTTTYNDLPATPLGLGIDTNDNIRFEFESPVDNALFRVDSQP